MSNRIIHLIKYKCVQCDVLFDPIYEYVKAMEHGLKEKHDIRGIFEEEMDIESYDENRRRFIITERTNTMIEQVKNGTYKPEVRDFKPKERYFDSNKHEKVDI